MTKPFEISRLRLYSKLSARGRYAGIPKGEDLLREILDVTGGRGVRPYRNPCGGWLELEEFRQYFPSILRNYADGVPADCVAASLGMEDDLALYNALEGKSVAREYDERHDRNLDAHLPRIL